MNNYEQKPRESGLSSSKWLFALCFLVYSAAYIARGNFAYARTTMISDGVLDVGTAGVLSAVYFGCYAVGQLINGAVADKRPPFLLVTVGLCIVAVSNAAMMLSTPASVRVLIWATNGFGQSMLWCPVFYIISNVLHSKVRFTAITVVTLCTPIGKAACAWLSGLAVSFGKWQNVFLMASSVIATVTILWVAGMLTLKKDLVIPQVGEKNNGQTTPKGEGALGLIVKSGMFFMLPAMLVYGLFLNGVVELIPSILSKEYGLSAASAALLDSLVPIIGSLGVILSNLLYIKIFKRNEMKSALFAMLISLLPMLVMFALALGKDDGYLLGRYADSALFVLTYGLVYVIQLAFGHFCVSLAPMRFTGFALAATFSGLANAVGYGGSAISSYVMSYAVERLPLWQTVLIWTACLAGASVFLIFALFKWNKFFKSIDETQ